MRIVLTSGLFQRRDSRGALVAYRRGDHADLPDKEAQRLITLGIAVDASDADPTTPTVTAESHTDAPTQATTSDDATPKPAAGSPEPTPAPATDTPKRPSPAMNREKWDAYARSVGVDPSKHKSKQELIAALP